MKYSTFIPLALALAVSALPAPRIAFVQENGQDAAALKYVPSSRPPISSD